MTDKQFQNEFATSFKSLSAELTRETNIITRTLTDAIASGEKGLDYWTKVRITIEGAYNKMLKKFSDWSKEAIPEQYKKYVTDIGKKMQDMKGITNMAVSTVNKFESAIGSSAITAPLYKDAILDMAKAITAGKSNMVRLTRMTQQKLVDEFTIDSAIAKAYESGDLGNVTKILTESSPAYKQLFMNMGTLEVKGRMFDPVYYAEMVARTKFHEAQSEASKSTAELYGTDLVIVSSHNTTTPLCQEHEGKIYSISGNHPDYDKLEESPPFHPNCLHLLYPYFETALEAEAN
jgi:hypothetical protein